MPGVAPEKAKFSNATDEIKTNSDALQNNTDILATADANIRVMHAKERKFKHLTDMSAARHKENMEKSGFPARDMPSDGCVLCAGIVRMCTARQQIASISTQRILLGRRASVISKKQTNGTRLQMQAPGV